MNLRRMMSTRMFLNLLTKQKLRESNKSLPSKSMIRSRFTAHKTISKRLKNLKLKKRKNLIDKKA